MSPNATRKTARRELRKSITRVSKNGTANGFGYFSRRNVSPRRERKARSVEEKEMEMTWGVDTGAGDAWSPCNIYLLLHHRAVFQLIRAMHMSM